MMLITAGSFASVIGTSEYDEESRKKECMNKVIALDDSLGKLRNHACEAVSLSESITQYVNGMEKFNYSHCPREFTKAFEKHRSSWVSMLSVTDKYPHLRGEMHELFKQLEKGPDSELFKVLLKSIWDTWAEVEAAIKKNQ